ncbi:MAG: hypothetical protein M3328_03070, partial [Chloroflexota bacterium]|nr:hypothetical protein [Chloroflexota bacterium]
GQGKAMTDVLNATITPATVEGDGNGTKRRAGKTSPAAKSDGNASAAKKDGKTPPPPVDIKTLRRKK